MCNEVAIFKDRIEIYNPGKFPEEVHPEDFFKGGGRSILRNPLIAETMYKSRDVEKWASGLKRINDECTAANVRVEFQQIPMGSVVVFHRLKWEEGEGLDESGQKRWSKVDLQTSCCFGLNQSEPLYFTEDPFRKTRYQSVRRPKAFGSSKKQGNYQAHRARQRRTLGNLECLSPC